jgi:hypothetical protein
MLVPYYCCQGFARATPLKLLCHELVIWFNFNDFNGHVSCESPFHQAVSRQASADQGYTRPQRLPTFPGLALAAAADPDRLQRA